VNLVSLKPFEQGQDVAKQLLTLFVLPLVEQIHPKLIEELGSFRHILSQLQIVLFIYNILRFPINNFRYIFESTMVLALRYQPPCSDLKILYIVFATSVILCLLMPDLFYLAKTSKWS